jgi:hypothetical protein
MTHLIKRRNDHDRSGGCCAGNRSRHKESKPRDDPKGHRENDDLTSGVIQALGTLAPSQWDLYRAAGMRPNALRASLGKLTLTGL